MDPTMVAIFGTLMFLILLFCGVQIAVAMMVTGFLGVWAIIDFNAAFVLVGTTMHAIGSEYGLAVIPLFILMGSFAMYGGFADGAYKALNIWLQRLPGGLAIATTMACAAFGAASGSSVATAAIFTRISLPEMRKYGYDPVLSVGSIACAGTFATMMPPAFC